MNAEAVLQYDAPLDELIGGKIVLMSPSPNLNHVRIASNVYRLLYVHAESIKGSRCEVFPDGFDVHLTETDRFKPDCMVVCDPDKVKYDGVHGAPDLVVEVLSPSTMKRDKTYKKDVYEKCGVREYWIVDPANRSVEQYILEEGRFVMRDLYVIYEDYVLDSMSEEKKASIVTEFKCSLSDEPVLKLEDIFARIVK